MDRIGKARGLIRFAAEKQQAGRRPRLAVYGGLLLAGVLLGAGYLAERTLLRVDVLRDRGALARETAEGGIENAYTLKLMNLADVPRHFRVAVSGLAGLEIVGSDRFSVAPGSIRPVTLTVAATPADLPTGIRAITFEIVAEDDPAIRVRQPSSFVLP